MDLGLRDRVCVVTGSTGGIGLATARLLGSEGARVVVCGRDSRRVETARMEAGAALGVVADLSAPDAPEALVNEAMWQLNVMSYVRAIRAVLPQMRERRDGVIVNVSSTAGKRPSTGMPNYSVTKAAVLSLSRLVADLYSNEGIRSNAVTPGPTATE